MAKRRRLDLGDPAARLAGGAEPPQGTAPGPFAPKGRPPIAQVASDSAAAAALDAVSAEFAKVRAEGRLVLRLRLSDVRLDHLIRDRRGLEPEAFEELKASLAARGQQTPVEVADLGEGTVPRYGLISGWRRMRALAALEAETGEARFGEVLALLRPVEDGPEGRARAYAAMVEENEIRSALSFWERARIVHRAVGAGVFPDETTALQTLFASASYARRSKIKSFVPLVAALDDVLRFPERVTERTGLALAKRLSAEGDDGCALASRLSAALAAADPADPEAEAQILAAELSGAGRTAPPSPRTSTPRSGVTLERRAGRAVLHGEGVDEALLDRLEAWLAKH